MKETSQKNIQRQIANLIPLIELCLPFAKEINKTQDKLNALPDRIERLKKQAKLLEVKMSCKSSLDSPIADSQLRPFEYKTLGNASRSQIEATELELDYLVNDLDEVLVHLANFKYKIANLIVLRERVEALQEERLENITPERIDKLLEKQRLQNIHESSRKPSPKKPSLQKLRQKIVGDRRYRKIATSTAIVTGLILSLSTISYFSINYRIVERDNIQQSKEL